jgi:hypothetical protein
MMGRSLLLIFGWGDCFVVEKMKGRSLVVDLDWGDRFVVERKGRSLV